MADFGVARFQNNGGVMTAETGTYRWMAPEVGPPFNSLDVLMYIVYLGRYGAPKYFCWWLSF